jgi:magnesium transporter
MNVETLNFLFLSQILRLPVVSAKDGKVLGRIVDLTAATGPVYPRITGLIVSPRFQRKQIFIPWSFVKRNTFQKSITVAGLTPEDQAKPVPGDAQIFVARSFLDKQIISTTGRKVVRVNDLHLLLDSSSKENPNLWLVHVDIGMRGLLRRLGMLGGVNSVVHWLVGEDIKESFVPWKNVQPTSTTGPAGSLEIAADSRKLAEIHPADLSDILEDLGIDERLSLLESIDPALAALALKEMSHRTQLQILDSMEPESLAAIAPHMQIDEILDLLDDLPSERRDVLLQALPKEDLEEVRSLKKLSAHGAGSLMNTDFVTVDTSLTVSEVLTLIHDAAKEVELLYYLYVLDDDGRLKGVLSLRSVLAANPNQTVAEIMTASPITITADTSIKRLARLFFKYNFEALPVVDDERRLQGFVTLRDALEQTFPEIRQEIEG